MQSVDVSYSRYMFYSDMGMKIDMDNYRILFIGQKYFEKRFNMSKEELINIYSFKRDRDILLKNKRKIK